jgi:colanic acid/amylovoran biosynthesis glycosyltransferase
VPGSESYVRRIKKMLPTCDVYHCVSDSIMQEAQLYGLNPKRAWIIKPAVDTSFFVPPQASSVNGHIRIVTVGALIWRKGYEYALLALKRLIESGSDATLTIVGDGPERDRILYTVSDLKLEERVTFTGSLPPEKVRDVLQDSHVFLLTSLSEGIANVVLEGMACGLPVVTSDAPGMREAVQDGEEGFVVPLRDAEAAASRLQDLIAHPELRRAMGSRARARAVKEFDLKDQGQKLLEMYRSLLPS